MLQLLQANPWLIAAGLAMLIPIFGVIFGTITQHLTRVRLAEMDAALKQEMSRRKGKKSPVESLVEREIDSR